MPIDSSSIRQRLWQAAGILLGFSSDELSSDISNLSDGSFGDLNSTATLIALQRHVVAIERLAQTIDHIHLEQKTQTALIERIAISNEGQWDCCRHSAERTEALLEITMKNPEATPQERYALYESYLSGGDHAGGG